MNELQKEKIDELVKKNKEYQKDLLNLHSEMEKKYTKTQIVKNDFYALMEKMEQAHSQIPFDPYHNVYCIEGDNFTRPSGPFIIDDMFGQFNPQFKGLSTDWMDSTEKKLDKLTETINEIINEVSTKLYDFLTDIIASNSITKRLKGLEEKTSELEEMPTHIKYPQELSKYSYSLKGSFILPLTLRGTHPTMKTPFHRHLLIKYDSLFQTINFQPGIVKKTIGILKYINEFLPFAELVPVENIKEKNINIQNIVSPKDVTIGSNNKFNGQIDIGNRES